MAQVVAANSWYQIGYYESWKRVRRSEMKAVSRLVPPWPCANLCRDPLHVAHHHASSPMHHQRNLWNLQKGGFPLQKTQSLDNFDLLVHVVKLAHLCCCLRKVNTGLATWSYPDAKYIRSCNSAQYPCVAFRGACSKQTVAL